MDATEPDQPTEPSEPQETTGQDDAPDLDAVSDAIEQAHEAEATLLAVDPNAIHPREVEHPEQVAEERAEDSADEPTEPDTSVTEEPTGPRAPSDEPG